MGTVDVVLFRLGEAPARCFRSLVRNRVPSLFDGIVCLTRPSGEANDETAWCAGARMAHIYAGRLKRP
jgi:hypothetical protein